MRCQCYRLSGEGAETLAVGDTITVSGTIKNYKGTIEFDKGCTLTLWSRRSNRFLTEGESCISGTPFSVRKTPCFRSWKHGV